MKAKRKYKSDVLGMKKSQKKLKKTAGFVMDVGVSQMMISTARGLR